MTGTEKAIVRAWSAVVARGGSGNADEVMVEMRRQGTVPGPEVGRLLVDLRARGALP